MFDNVIENVKNKIKKVEKENEQSHSKRYFCSESNLFVQSEIIYKNFINEKVYQIFMTKARRNEKIND
jgi:hypothetical protein